MHPKNQADLLDMLRLAKDNDLMSMEMFGMIERILQVSEMQVREVMVPKSNMITVSHACSIDTLLPTVIESGHSRFPVWDEDSEKIIGILLAKDLLKFCIKKESTAFKMGEIIRPAMFVPQSKRLDILLKEFRVNRNHLAIVLDEYGLVEGLVTIEDVLEQIVGEIEDEYDIEEEDVHIKKLKDGTYIVKAITPIEEMNEYFHTHFDEEEFDTIAGLLLKKFGHFPKRSEKIKMGGLRFRVLHSDSRRLYLLEVKEINKG